MELIRKRKEVKRKLKLLKQGERAHENFFSPITKHLQNIQIKLPLNDTPDKKEIIEKVKQEKEEEEEEEEEEESDVESDNPSDLKMSILDDIKSPNIETNIESELLNTDNETSSIDLNQFASLPRHYVDGMLSDETNKEFDHKYGVRRVINQLFIGNSKLDIKDRDIIVQNKRYKGTNGLYELLFKKTPKNYTQEDEQNYTDIVIKTNAHKRYYKSNKQVDGSKSSKYKKIIAPLTKGGGGMYMSVNDNKIDYIHWNNPNELVERLRLLLASQSAGNTNHTNEIVSIIEELREAEIIE